MEIALLKKQAKNTVQKLTDNKWYNTLVETIDDWIFLLIFFVVWGYAISKGLSIVYILVHLFLYMYFLNLTKRTYGDNR